MTKRCKMHSLFDLQVHSYESNLTVSINEATVGTYICRASVRGFTEISSKAEILMRGPPRVIRKDQIQFGRVGSNVQVCSFCVPCRVIDYL